MSPDVYSPPAAPIDTPEEIAEMMAEAARIDALFQSGAISTMFLLGCPEISSSHKKSEAPGAVKRREPRLQSLSAVITD